jgi:uncharacterized membrane protein
VPMAVYDLLMFLHVLAAMVWLGGLVGLAAFGSYALRKGAPDSVARFLASSGVLGPILGPASLLVLGFGVWMVIDSGAWNFGQTWIWLGLALLGAAFLVGGVLVGGSSHAAQRAVDAGDHAQAMRHLRRWSWGIRLVLMLLVVATWDMVFKPGV